MKLIAEVPHKLCRKRDDAASLSSAISVRRPKIRNLILAVLEIRLFTTGPLLAVSRTKFQNFKGYWLQSPGA